MTELTQEEIDALLRGEDPKSKESTGELDLSKYAGGAPPPPTEPVISDMCAEIEESDEQAEDISQYLTQVEIDALGEIGNICMGNSATTMSTVLGRRVVITTPTVKLFKPENVLTAYHCPFMLVSVNYVEGIFGRNILILKDTDAAMITDLMMGGDGHIDTTDVVIDELHLSAMSEIMNQMIGASATAMSNMLGYAVNISPPNAENIKADEGVERFLDDSELVIRISFDMEIEGILKSKLIQMMSLELAHELVASQMGDAVSPAPAPKPAAPAPAAPAPKPAPAPAPAAPAPAPKPAPRPAPRPAPPPKPEPKVEVKPVVCTEFDVPDAELDSFTGNLELISDIPLQVTVELGRTKRTLNEVMNLGSGSIVALDRLAGEPVDIIVNGKPVAKGEVVVVDENYGVRVTEMLTRADVALLMKA